MRLPIRICPAAFGRPVFVTAANDILNISRFHRSDTFLH